MRYASKSDELTYLWERSGSMVEYMTRDLEATGFEPHRRHCVVPLTKTHLS